MIKRRKDVDASEAFKKACADNDYPVDGLDNEISDDTFSILKYISKEDCERRG